MKDFITDFEIFKDKIKNKKYFAFSRYSDGELYVMQNKRVEIGNNFVTIGDKTTPANFPSEDHKLFEPSNPEHQALRLSLIEAYCYRAPGYYKGISCRCCVGEENASYFKTLGNTDESDLTWANLWVNCNYPRYMNEVYPLYPTYDKIIVVCSNLAHFDNLNFKDNIVADFRVGKNCVINDRGLIITMLEYFRMHDVRDHLVLFSASSLSQLLIRSLYEKFPNNTYINIGTTLNPLMGMKMARGYQFNYFYGVRDEFGEKKCIW